MKRDYVEERDGGYWIRGRRVSLDSIVYAFLRGAPPESIAHSFPIITLEDVYGASHSCPYRTEGQKRRMSCGFPLNAG